MMMVLMMRNYGDYDDDDDGDGDGDGDGETDSKNDIA